MSGELSNHNNIICTNSTVDPNVQKNKWIKLVRSKEKEVNGYPKQECDAIVLIGLALKNSVSCSLDEIYKFILSNFPFYKFTS